MEDERINEKPRLDNLASVEREKFVKLVQIIGSTQYLKAKIKHWPFLLKFIDIVLLVYIKNNLFKCPYECRFTF